MTFHTRLWLLLASLLLSVLSSSAAAVAAAGEIETERDVVYSTPQGEPLKLNLARPKQIDSLAPAVICMHGGGWGGGSRGSWDGLCRQLAERGFVAVTVSYRLTPKHSFPAQIEDVKAGVRWLRANAERLKIDPDRIGAVGDSAGGHLALMLGTTGGTRRFDTAGDHLDRSSQVQCIVSVYGPSDLVRLYRVPAIKGLLVPFLGGDPEHQRQRYVLASPLNWVTPDAAPMLMIHGSKDDGVPIEQSQLINQRLKAAGVASDLLVIEGAGHGFNYDDNKRANEAAIAFFEKHLKPDKK